MDTDLRRSMVHKHFNLDAKVGVTNVLLGEKDIKDAIFKTELEGLFVMPAGPCSRRSGQVAGIPENASVDCRSSGKYSIS